MLLSLTFVVSSFILFGVIFWGFNELVSEGSKVFTKYSIENENVKKTNYEELLIECAKDVILRRVTLNGDVKWGRSKILCKDRFEKYLIYLEYEAQNSFGAYISQAVIMCIKLDENKSSYSYRENPVAYIVSKADNLDNINYSYLCSNFKWDKEILYEDTYKEKYKFKNFLKSIKGKIAIACLCMILISVLGFTCIVKINNSKYSTTKTESTGVSESKSKYDLTDEVKSTFIQNWNKISGYGTSNIQKAIIDLELGRIYIVYTDTSRNGLYVHSDGSVGANYGSEIYSKYTGSTYREMEEGVYSTLLKTWPDRYKKLTQSEFIDFLKYLSD